MRKVLLMCVLLGILAGCAGTQLKPSQYEKGGKPSPDGVGAKTTVFEF